MSIYPSFRYQLWDHRTAILVYYIVLAGMLLASLIAVPFISIGSGDFVSTNGVTAVTTVFAFVLSLCAFKDSFLMNLQHGVSRRSFFLGRLAVMGTVCGILALLDEAYTLLLKGLQAIWPHAFLSSSLYEMIYCYTPKEGGFTIETSPATILMSVVFSFFVLLAASSLGYLVTAFMYRLNKTGKILFWAGAPILLVILASYCGTYPYSPVTRFVEDALMLAAECIATLPRLMLTCTVCTLTFSGLSWLLMRRAAVK